MTRILGIDPGSQRTGIGVIDVAADGRCTFVHCEAIKLLDAADFPSRLGLLCENLERVLGRVAARTGRHRDSVHGQVGDNRRSSSATPWRGLATVVPGTCRSANNAPRVIKQSLVGVAPPTRSRCSTWCACFSIWPA